MAMNLEAEFLELTVAPLSINGLPSSSENEKAGLGELRHYRSADAYMTLAATYRFADCAISRI
jgi:hypothetical protein